MAQMQICEIFKVHIFLYTPNWANHINEFLNSVNENVKCSEKFLQANYKQNSFQNIRHLNILNDNTIFTIFVLTIIKILTILNKLKITPKLDTFE